MRVRLAAKILSVAEGCRRVSKRLPFVICMGLLLRGGTGRERLEAKKEATSIVMMEFVALTIKIDCFQLLGFARGMVR